MERKRLRKRLTRPLPCKAVSGKYVYNPETGKREFENKDWLPYLTKIIKDPLYGKKRVGLNPKDIDPQTLTDAGHPPRSATNRIRVYMLDIRKPFLAKRDSGLKRLRELCLECAGSPHAVRQCAIINCPLWNHRLGFNPHNYHKRQQNDDED